MPGNDPSAPDAAGARSNEEFLEMWKRVSDECAPGIFMSLHITTPTVSGRMREAAIDNIMRRVWGRTYEQIGHYAIYDNLDAIKEYTGRLVDKVVAEHWEKVWCKS